MTAIVGILNKKGIAIAADSAVTFSMGQEPCTTKMAKRNRKLLILVIRCFD